MVNNHKPIVIFGPSGSGKTTLVKNIVLPSDSNLVKTVTTRIKRTQEDDDYEFVSETHFRWLIDNNLLFEWSVVHGNLYGTPKNEFKTQHPLIILDISGALRIRFLFPESALIFIDVPDHELRQRLKARDSGEDPLRNSKRLRNSERLWCRAHKHLAHTVIRSNLPTATNLLQQTIKKYAQR